MNKGAFFTSINSAADILRKLKFLKDRRQILIGQYSQASLEIANCGDLKTIYDIAIDNRDYELLLDDDSIFQFNKNGDSYRYAFIQSHVTYYSFLDFLAEIFDEDEIPKDNDSLEEIRIDYAEDYEQRRNEQKLNLGAMYIRYDADAKGYRPNFHSYAHFHIGINNSFRLPSSIILTPLSFVLFVLKHVYISLWEIALKERIINDEIFQFKQLCENVPEDLWCQQEKMEFYIT